MKFRVTRLPFNVKKFQGITLPFVVILAKNADRIVLNHEIIHCRQIKIFGYYSFYKEYIVQFTRNYLRTFDFDYSYSHIWFEFVAYRIQDKVDYIKEHYNENKKIIEV
jgi:hypothetical protein